MEKREQEKQTGIDWALVLPIGEKNAISAGELTRRLNFTDTRTTRAAVMAARLSGVPVCSLQSSEKSAGGYFLPDAEHPEEVEHAMNTLRKRAFSSLKQAGKLNAWIKMHGGAGYSEQVTIEKFMEEEGKK